MMIMSRLYYYLVLVFVTGSVISFSPSLVCADRLTKLETEMMALNSRFDDFRDAMNKRFEDLQHNMNKRFDDMNNRFDDMNNRIDDMNKRIDDTNKRIDDMMFWLQFIAGMLVLMIAGLVAQWLMMWKKVFKAEAITEHLKETAVEKDRVIVLQRQEIDLLKDSIAEIRKQLQMPEMASA